MDTYRICELVRKIFVVSWILGTKYLVLECAVGVCRKPPFLHALNCWIEDCGVMKGWEINKAREGGLVVAADEDNSDFNYTETGDQTINYSTSIFLYNSGILSGNISLLIVSGYPRHWQRVSVKDDLGVRETCHIEPSLVTPSICIILIPINF